MIHMNICTFFLNRFQSWGEKLRYHNRNYIIVCNSSKYSEATCCTLYDKSLVHQFCSSFTFIPYVATKIPSSSRRHQKVHQTVKSTYLDAVTHIAIACLWCGTSYSAMDRLIHQPLWHNPFMMPQRWELTCCIA